jgi:hypothetical protein
MKSGREAIEQVRKNCMQKDWGLLGDPKKMVTKDITIIKYTMYLHRRAM